MNIPTIKQLSFNHLHIFDPFKSFVSPGFSPILSGGLFAAVEEEWLSLADIGI
jgi:hypothetical protein